MPSMFSDHFNSNVDPGVVDTLAGELPLDTQQRVGAGRGHARYRTKRMRIQAGTAAGIGDRLVMGQFKSNDRIFKVLLAADGGSAAGAVDIGIYQGGTNHDGLVIDADLFASALDISSAILNVDQFKESAILDDQDRGKRLWELANLGGGVAFAANPFQDWDLVLGVSTAFTTAVTDLVVTVEYTSGD